MNLANNAVSGHDGGCSSSSFCTSQTTIKRSGAYAWKSDSTGTNDSGYVTAYENGASFFMFDGRTYFFRNWLYFENYPASTIQIVNVSDGTFQGLVFRMTSAGVVQGRNLTAGADIGNASETIALDTWHKFEISFTLSVAGNDTYEMRLNNTTLASGTAAISANETGWNLYTGWNEPPGSSRVCYIDDIAINDSDTASENSWCGDGKVVLLVPTSDSVRDTLWTGGVGGTTNLFDAVNNRPPLGTATETNLTQIEHAGGAAGTTDDYEANMTTYSAAGIGPTDKVKFVEAFIIDGEDISSGAKLLAIEVLSNPAIAISTNFTVGDATPTLLGTYPSEWGRHRNANISYSPSVTLGTAPVMRVRRPETASRVASVCFMGMYVEYIPGPLPKPIKQMQAVKRAAYH